MTNAEFVLANGGGHIVVIGSNYCEQERRKKVIPKRLLVPEQLATVDNSMWTLFFLCDEQYTTFVSLRACRICEGNAEASS